jgi:hypothetical protein
MFQALLSPPFEGIYPAPVRSAVDRALTIFGLDQRATGRLPFPISEIPDHGVRSGDWLKSTLIWEGPKCLASQAL